MPNDELIFAILGAITRDPLKATFPIALIILLVAFCTKGDRDKL